MCQLKRFFYVFLSILNYLKFFATVAVLDKCLLYCKPIVGLRYEGNHCETVFIQVEHFGILLQVLIRVQMLVNT